MIRRNKEILDENLKHERADLLTTLCALVSSSCLSSVLSLFSEGDPGRGAPRGGAF